MKTDEVLKSFDLLMKRKNRFKLSGAYEARAYREQAKLLGKHYLVALSCEKKSNHDK
jgi:hypothetical protein